MKNKLNKFDYCLCLLAFMFFLVSFIPQNTHCGSERWDVKTLTDKASSTICWQPKNTSVSILALLTQPYPKDKKFDKSIRFAYELNTYKVECRIREFRKEDDGDYHLVLMDLKDTTKTIVGEIINPECPDLKDSPYMNSFIDVRQEFEKWKLPNNKVTYATYTIVGVCFFDKIHGQLGVAPNGVELHPIMDLQKSSK